MDYKGGIVTAKVGIASDKFEFFGDYKESDIQGIIGIVENDGISSARKASHRYFEEDGTYTVPAGGSKELEYMSVVCNRDGAGAVYIKGKQSNDKADILALKNSLKSTQIGGASVTDVSINMSL